MLRVRSRFQIKGGESIFTWIWLKIWNKHVDSTMSFSNLHKINNNRSFMKCNMCMYKDDWNTDHRNRRWLKKSPHYRGPHKKIIYQKNLLPKTVITTFRRPIRNWVTQLEKDILVSFCSLVNTVKKNKLSGGIIWFHVLNRQKRTFSHNYIELHLKLWVL